MDEYKPGLKRSWISCNINLVALLFDWTYAFVHLIRHLYFVLVSHIPLVLGFSHLKQSWKREKSR
jgi:hypothetical protein